MKLMGEKPNDIEMSKVSATVDDHFKVISLSLEYQRSYFDAIVKNDAGTVKHILDNPEELPVESWLNGDFMYPGDVGHISAHKKRHLMFKKPIVVAAAYGSAKVLHELLDRGALPSISDVYGNNVIHCLIYATKNNYEFETVYRAMLQIILSYIPKVGDRKKLLMMPDKEDFRPLELAMKEEAFGIYHDLLHTEGVYQFTMQQKGLCTQYQFRLHEYMIGGSRAYTSPLIALASSPAESFHKIAETGVMTSPIMKAWMKKVNREAFIFMMLNCIFYLSLPCLLFLPLDYSSRNFCNWTSGLPVDGKTEADLFSDPLVIGMVGFSSVLFVVAVICTLPVYLHSHKIIKMALTFYHSIIWEWAFDDLLVFLLLVLLICAYVPGLHCKRDFFTYGFIPVTVILMYLVTFPIRLIPKVGEFFGGIRRLISDTLVCVLAVVVIGIVFAGTILCLSNMLNTSKTYTFVFKDALLHSFLLMVSSRGNSMPISHQTFDIYHTMFTLIAGILFINFILTTMADMSNHSTKHKKMHHTLVKLRYDLRIFCMFSSILHICTQCKKNKAPGLVVTMAAEPNPLEHY